MTNAEISPTVLNLPPDPTEPSGTSSVPAAAPIPVYTPPTPSFDSVLTNSANVPAPVVPAPVEAVAPATAPSVENLGNVITNPLARRIVYGLYIIGLVILGAIAAYFLATGAKLPIQLVGAVGVAAFLGAPMAGLALSNTPKSK